MLRCVDVLAPRRLEAYRPKQARILMSFKLITATIDTQLVEKVERCLREIAVPGLSVSKTKGYGDYKNFFQRDLLTAHARIQVYVPAARAEEVVHAIMDVAHTGSEADGIVVVSPVDAIYRITDKAPVPDGD